MDEYAIYKYLKNRCGIILWVNENFIRNAVGQMGLDILLETKLIEPCGIIYGVPTYALCCEEES